MELSPESDAARIGKFVPATVKSADFLRVPDDLMAAVRSLTGVAASVSDILDEMGLRLAVPATTLTPRLAGQVVVGQVITMEYLPERGTRLAGPRIEVPSKLAHQELFSSGRRGDVAVVSVLGEWGVSVLGGLAAHHARQAGIAACIVDGGVRDVDEIGQLGLPVWSRYVTPTTGRGRVEAVAINAPICCGSVQVNPGDVVVADDTGICFVPADLSATVARRVLETAEAEGAVRRATS